MKYRSPMLRQSELLQNRGVATEEEVGWVGTGGLAGVHRAIQCGALKQEEEKRHE